MFRIIFISIMLYASSQKNCVAETTPEKNYTSEEMLILGERMYRQGILPDGKAMQAIISEDIPVDGRMFTCVNCHQRSGQGSIEGSIITWPINGKELFKPRRRTGAWHAAKQKKGPGASQRWSLPSQYQADDARPEFTDETLARLLRDGVDSGNRVLERGMPRYQLTDNDLQVLTHYLKNLSVNFDEGVDNNKIRFATVITEGVSEKDKEAMLTVLKTHIETHNIQTRPHQRRAVAGPFYKTEKYGAYRKFELDVWKLNGPQNTWRSQLNNFYKNNPVFAMLGGISSGPWAPIHNFCEEKKLPCIFPITDQPVISETDWYTLYFSKGYYQEGETAARYLRSKINNKQHLKVLQIYSNTDKGKLLAKGFRENIDGSNTITTEKVLSSDEPVSDQLLQYLTDTHKPDVLLLWLNETNMITATKFISKKIHQPKMIFTSWKLLNGKISFIPENLRQKLYLTYPRDLPENNARSISVLKRWLTIRKIPITNLDIQSRMYFLGWMLPGTISHIRSEFFRDYFIESFDMMHDQDYAIAVFPRLTFGPGQRYASKGCYIVQLGNKKQPELIKMSEWIIH